MTENSRIIKNTTYLFIGSAIADVGAFLFRVIVARDVGASEFGIFSLALMTVSVSTSVALFGLPDGIVTFVSKFRKTGESGKITGVLIVSFLVVGVLSIFLTMLLWILAPWISITVFSASGLMPVLRIFAIGIPGKAIIALTSAFCLSYEKAGLQTLIRRVFPKAGTLIAAAVVIMTGGGLANIVEAYVFVLWATAGFGAIVTYFIVRSENVSKVNPNTKELLIFSTPLLLSGFAELFLQWTDTVLVGYYMTTDAVGVYQSAYLLGAAIGTFRTVISTSLYPNFGPLIAEGDMQTLRDRYLTGVKWIVILTAAPAVYLLTFAEQSLFVLFGKDFSAGHAPLMMFAVGQFIAVSVGPATTALKALGESKFILVTTVLALLINLGLNVALIPEFGITGAAVATMAGTIVSNGSHLWKARRILGIVLPIRNLIFIVLIALLSAFMVNLGLWDPSSFKSLVFHILVFSSTYSIGILGTGIVKLDTKHIFR